MEKVFSAHKYENVEKSGFGLSHSQKVPLNAS